MATKGSNRPKTPPVDAVQGEDRASELVAIINRTFDEFDGVIDELEKAVGMLMLGDYVGWKVLVIIHSKRTIRKYEEILGIKVREFFPEEGPCAMRSVGYKTALKLGQFWKAVSGDILIPERRDIAKG